MSKVMVVVNLHEIEFLNEVLEALARAQVRDCVVQQAECMPSYHPGAGPEPNMLASVAGLFKPQHNLNYLIMAVADEESMGQITMSLKALYKEDRYACSFGFVPMIGYWYHKTQEAEETEEAED
ncbi:MAG: hypothetical protein ACU836_16840 [Gammaproteobacteria bacterium]